MDSGLCTSPNRALWRSLTSLQAENSDLKVKLEAQRLALERQSTGERALARGGSSKFLKMELEQAAAEVKSLRGQLEAAQAQRAGAEAELSCARLLLGEREAQVAVLQQQLAGALGESEHAAKCLAQQAAEVEALRARLAEQAAYITAQEETAMRAMDVLTESQAQLQGKERELAEAAARLSGLQTELAEREAALEAAQQAQLRSEAQLQGMKRQLQYAEAELAETRDKLDATRTSREAAEASLRSELTRLQAEKEEQAAAVAQLRQRLAASNVAGSGNAGECHASGPCSPASIGGQSESAAGCGLDEGQRLCTPGGLPPASTPGSTVYNVMIGSPGTEHAAAQQEQERLTRQVLSLQDKLGALQAAHEALLQDYSVISEQLAARQAEVQLARLSPESCQLKRQVEQLQDQVLSLQQELFASRSFSLPGLSPLAGAAAGSPPLSPPEDGLIAAPPGSRPALGRDGRGLKRSFTRAASSIGRAMLGMRRQKSSASLGAGSLAAGSRDASFSESIASRSQSVSPCCAASLGLHHTDDNSVRAAQAEAEVLALRQELQQSQQGASLLEQRLAAELAQQQLLQAAIMQQGEDLAEAREVLAKTRTELETATEACKQLTDMQSVPIEVALPSGSDHTKCREAVDTLFRQVWRERMARQKAESRMEQQQAASRRTTLTGQVLDEETLQRLQAEALAADTLAVELQKAKGHQLQLQQRLEALQLELAKQSSLMGSARSGRSPRGAPAGRASPSTGAMQLHHSLRLAEERAREAELRLTVTERQVAQVKRRERDMNQVIAQAAEWRRDAERRHEQAKEAWGRRLSAKQLELRQLEARLHATAIAQKELLSGLEVLETMLRKRGEPGSARASRQGLATPRTTSSDSQEALKQIASLLRTANTHLQILSPQQSDCVGRGDGGSPRGKHHAMSVTAGPRLSGEAGGAAWCLQAAEQLSEPLSPRAMDGLGSEQLSREAQPPGLAAGAAASSSSLDDVLQAILGDADAQEYSSPRVPAAASSAGPDGHAMEQDAAHSAARVPPSLPEGSMRSMGPGDLASISFLSSGTIVPQQHTSCCSRSGTGAQEAAPRPAECALPLSSPELIRAHQPATAQAGNSDGRLSVQLPAATPGGSASSSPRRKGLAAKIGSGLKRMGCSESKTRSGTTTPAAKPSVDRHSATGGADTPGSARRNGAPVQSTTALLKPRKIWV